MQKRWIAIAGLLIVAAATLGFSRKAPTGAVARESNARAKASHGETMPSEPAGSATLVGTVIQSETGEAIAGAVVTLTVSHKSSQSISGPDQRPDIVQSDAQGSWRLMALPPAEYSLTGTAPGFSPSTVADISLAVGQERSVEIRLSRHQGKSLSGVVEDVGGGPLVGAVVTIVPAAAQTGASRISTLVDSAGSYVIAVANGFYSVTVWFEGYVAEERRFQILDGDRREDWRLYPESRIEGRVLREADGAPVVGAFVLSRRERPSFRGKMPDTGTEETTVVTGQNGVFVMHGLKTGSHTISATREGFGGSMGATVDLGIGQTITDVTVYVRSAYSIRGRVVYGGSGRPVPDASVFAKAIDGTAIGSMETTDDNGAFAIHGVFPGDLQVGAEAPSAAPEMAWVNVSIDDKDASDVVVFLNEGATISGRVEPATKAHVYLTVAPGTLEMERIYTAFVAAQTMSVDTDEQGGFVLENVAQGDWLIVAETQNGRKGEAELRVGLADASDVVVLVEDKASLRGTVVDDTGAPVQGLTVVMRPRRKLNPAETAMLMLERTSNRDGVPSDENGNFYFSALDPGAYGIEADDSVYMRWVTGKHRDNTGAPIGVVLAQGEHKTGFVLEVRSNRGTITGRVTDSDGTPVADAYVTARLEGDYLPNGTFERQGLALAEPPVLTDADGDFVVRNLRLGYYDLVAEAPRLNATAFVSRVGLGKDVALRVNARGAIRGRVTTQVPTQSCDLFLLGPQEEEQRAFGPDCSFEVSRLEPGTYQLSVSAQVGQSKKEVIVRSGKTTDVSFQLDGWASLRGRLVDRRSGAPLAGYRVIVAVEQTKQERSWIGKLLTGDIPRTAEDGTFEFKQLPAGLAKLAVLPMGPLDEPLLLETFTITAATPLDVGNVGVNVTSKQEHVEGE